MYKTNLVTFIIQSKVYFYCPTSFLENCKENVPYIVFLELRPCPVFGMSDQQMKKKNFQTVTLKWHVADLLRGTVRT